MADEIQKFIDGTGGPWDWDDFISVRVRDPHLEQIRVTCIATSEKFPAGALGWCNAEGLDYLRTVVDKLRLEGERRRREAIDEQK
jgi:hypothetical protein